MWGTTEPLDWHSAGAIFIKHLKARKKQNKNKIPDDPQWFVVYSHLNGLLCIVISKACCVQSSQRLVVYSHLNGLLCIVISMACCVQSSQRLVVYSHLNGLLCIVISMVGCV